MQLVLRYVSIFHISFQTLASSVDGLEDVSREWSTSESEEEEVPDDDGMPSLQSQMRDEWIDNLLRERRELQEVRKLYCIFLV